jgi:hypothetical protein
LPGLEIHTLDQVVPTDRQLDNELLELATRAGSDGRSPSDVEKTPEYPGVDLLMDENLRSSTGEHLPTVKDMMSLREKWLASGTMLGELIAKTTISPTTGCWIKLSEKRKGELAPSWRNSEGYVVVKNPHRFGLPKRSDEEEKRGMLFHRLIPTLLCMELGIDPIIGPKKDGDHTCRNKACGIHVSGMTNKENNLLRLKAVKVEKALISGQMVMGSLGVEWLDTRVSEAQQEDTDLVFTTPEGPYRLMKANDEPIVIYAQREPDDVFDSLRKPSRSNRNFKSRAKLRTPLKGEKPMFSPLRYRTSKPKPKALYKEMMDSI